jgi:hypothetical protein
MNRLIVGVALFTGLVTQSGAAVYCNGTVQSVVKWSNQTSLSIKILMNDGTVTNAITMPTKSDEAMALAAVASGQPIQLYWSAGDVSTCVNGWSNYRALEGYFVVAR